MSCEIIQFSSFAAATKEAEQAAADPYSQDTFVQYRAERLARQAKRIAVLETAPETLTVTCRNKRLREQRKIAWGWSRITPAQGLKDRCALREGQRWCLA
jgi:hypothetical protein